MRVLFLGVLFLVVASFCVIGAAQYRPPGIEVVEPPIDLVVPADIVAEPEADLEQPPQQKNVPDEFDLRVLDFRVNEYEKAIFKIWETEAQSQMHISSEETVAHLKENAARMTRELKQLRRERDELRTALGAPVQLDDHSASGEPQPGDAPTAEGQPGVASPENAVHIRLRSQNEALRKILRAEKFAGLNPLTVSDLVRLRAENEVFREILNETGPSRSGLPGAPEPATVQAPQN